MITHKFFNQLPPEAVKIREAVFVKEQGFHNEFDDIDKNHDGKVTNQEIQAYGVDSELEKQKVADRNRIVNNMSMFYDTGADYEGSMLDYRYLDEDEG